MTARAINWLTEWIEIKIEIEVAAEKDTPCLRQTPRLRCEGAMLVTV